MGYRGTVGAGGVEMKGIIYNESPEEKMERFMRLVEADERRRLKEEYRAERRKDESGGKEE